MSPTVPEDALGPFCLLFKQHCRLQETQHVKQKKRLNKIENINFTLEINIICLLHIQNIPEIGGFPGISRRGGYISAYFSFSMQM